MGFRLPGLDLGGGGGNSGVGSGPASGFNKIQENLSTSTTSTVGASEGSYALNAGGNVSVLEPGAVKQSLDLAGQVNQSALNALTKTFEENLATLSQGFTQNVGLTTAALNKQTLDSGQQVSDTIKFVVIAAVIGVIGFIAVRKYA